MASTHTPDALSGPPRAEVRAWAAFALLVLAWGSSYLFIRFAIRSFTPLGISASRFLVAGLLCLALGRWRREAPPARRDLPKLALVGVLMMTGANALTAFAQATVPSGIAAVVHALSSVWLVVFGALPGLGRVAIRPRVLGAALLGVVGIGVLLWPAGGGAGGGAAPVGGLGAFALVLATWMFTVASLLQKKWRVAGGMFTLLAAEMLSAALVSGMLALLVGGVDGALLYAPLVPSAVLGFAWLTLVSSIVGFGAYGALLTWWPPARVGSFAVMSPLVAVFLGVVVAGEALSPRMLLGAAITLFAVHIVQRSA